MAVSYGARFDKGTNFVTEVDLDNSTCETTGFIDGEAVDFSGGGGDSDYSIAKVAFNNESSSNFVAYCPIIFNDTMLIAIDSADMDGSDIDVVMYKGASMISTYDFNGGISVTGNAEVSGYAVYITGDATITFSNEQ